MLEISSQCNRYTCINKVTSDSSSAIVAAEDKTMARSYTRAYHRKTDIKISLIAYLVIAVTLYAHQIIFVRSLGFVLLVVAAIFVSTKSRSWLSLLKRSTTTPSMNQIDRMPGSEFEKQIVRLLKKSHYTNIKLTEKYDLGVDIIATKDDICWGIQVKRYSGQVKADAVRQVVTALKRYGCQRSMVITNSTFSKIAQILAKSNECVLVDRVILSKWLS